MSVKGVRQFEMSKPISIERSNSIMPQKRQVKHCFQFVKKTLINTASFTPGGEGYFTNDESISAPLNPEGRGINSENRSLGNKADGYWARNPLGTHQYSSRRQNTGVQPLTYSPMQLEGTGYRRPTTLIGVIHFTHFSLRSDGKKLLIQVLFHIYQIKNLKFEICQCRRKKRSVTLTVWNIKLDINSTLSVA